MKAYASAAYMCPIPCDSRIVPQNHSFQEQLKNEGTALVNEIYRV